MNTTLIVIPNGVKSKILKKKACNTCKNKYFNYKN